jgi:hypothetical protein
MRIRKEMITAARRAVATVLLVSPLGLTTVARGQSFLQFDGLTNYVEVPDSQDFSVSTTGGLTVSAWMRPDVLNFPTPEGPGYVHWLGKGTPRRGPTPAQHEWVFRMYNLENAENRPNRISFYVFNLSGGEGIGSYFQDPVTPGEWIHVVGVADTEKTYIFKNGVFRRCDQYRGTGPRTCQQYDSSRWIQPEHGSAPVRMGTRDFRSYFQGSVAEVRVWNRPLTAEEIADLYANNIVPQEGLVAEYLLNEGDGTTAHDTAGGHDGTIFGATWAPPQ